jgi:PST family polysaccharide transporter
MGGTLESSVARGARWIGASTVVAAAATWTTALVLARLLDRHTFGLAALALLAVAVLQLFQDSGLHAALIQRRDHIREAADTASLYAPLLGLGLALLCLVVGPLAARFFHEPDVRGLVAGLGVVFALRSFAVVPTALIQRELRFDRLAVVVGGAAVLSFAATVALALAGAGAWSVVGGQIAASAFAAVASTVLAPWLPRPRRASLAELRRLLRYGRHIVAGNVVGFVNSNTDPVGVGRLYGPASLGAYTLGFQTGSQAVTMATGVANQLVFPAYAAVQADLPHFRRSYLRSLRFLCGISPPIAFGLAAVSGVAVPVLYGERWHAAIPVLAIISVYGLFLAVAATTGEVFKAAGRPELFFRMGLLQVALLFGLIGLLHGQGIVGFACARAGATIVMSIVALVLAGRILGLDARDWLGAGAAPVTSAAAMGLLVYATRAALRPVAEPALWLLAALVVEGVVLYLAVFRLLAPQRLHELLAEIDRIVPVGRLVRPRRSARLDRPRGEEGLADRRVASGGEVTS